MMRISLLATAAIGILALSFTGAQAFMLLQEDPSTNTRVIVDTTDPNYREKVYEHGVPGAPAVDELPQGAWVRTADEQGYEIVRNPATGETYYLVEPPAEVAAQGIPEGALFLAEDPYTTDKRVYREPMN